jgi:hypothetical protein
MSGTKIVMTGVDEAHFLAASETSSRVINFPDGKARHITLKNWYWQVLDKLHDVKGWPKSEVPMMVIEGAERFYTKGTPEFEEAIRWGFVYLIKLNMPYVMKDEGAWPGGNDDAFTSL